MTIPVYLADGSPLSEDEADTIMKAFGFSSARSAERVIADRELTNRSRGITSEASRAAKTTVAFQERAHRAAMERRPVTQLSEIVEWHIAERAAARESLDEQGRLTGDRVVDDALISHYLTESVAS